MIVIVINTFVAQLLLLVRRMGTKNKLASPVRMQEKPYIDARAPAYLNKV